MTINIAFWSFSGHDESKGKHNHKILHKKEKWITLCTILWLLNTEDKGSNFK